MSGWKWFDDEMQWKRQVPDSGEWTAGSPPLPGWAADRLPAARFIRLWGSSETINDVKKVLFWLDEEELEQERSRISAWLEEKGYVGLPLLPRREDVLLSEEELEALLDEGLLTRAEEEDTREDYDPVRAVLEAQEESASHLRSHIQTEELGGGMRFRAKH